jgi:hypothetical protein
MILIGRRYLRQSPVPVRSGPGGGKLLLGLGVVGLVALAGALVVPKVGRSDTGVVSVEFSWSANRVASPQDTRPRIAIALDNVDQLLVPPPTGLTATPDAQGQSHFIWTRAVKRTQRVRATAWEPVNHRDVVSGGINILIRFLRGDRVEIIDLGKRSNRGEFSVWMNQPHGWTQSGSFRYQDRAPDLHLVP